MVFNMAIHANAIAADALSGDKDVEMNAKNQWMRQILTEACLRFYSLVDK